MCRFGRITLTSSGAAAERSANIASFTDFSRGIWRVTSPAASFRARQLRVPTLWRPVVLVCAGQAAGQRCLPRCPGAPAGQRRLRESAAMAASAVCAACAVAAVLPTSAGTATVQHAACRGDGWCDAGATGGGGVR